MVVLKYACFSSQSCFFLRIFLLACDQHGTKEDSVIRKFSFALALLALTLSGCVYMVVGGIGLMGGYVVSPDTVEGIVEHSQEEVWDASLEIMEIMGKITESEEQFGTIIADVAGARVTVTLEAVSDSSTKIQVKARKTYLPRVKTAQDVYLKITRHLSE